MQKNGTLAEWKEKKIERKKKKTGGEYIDQCNIDTKTDFAVRGEKDIYIYIVETRVYVFSLFFFFFFFFKQ